MAKFEVRYTAIITRNYSITVSAEDEDEAESRVQERLDKITMSTQTFPGTVEDDNVEFEIEDVDEV